MAAFDNITQFEASGCRLLFKDVSNNVLFNFALPTTIAFVNPTTGTLTIKDGTGSAVTLSSAKQTALSIAYSDVATAIVDCTTLLGGGVV